MEPKLKQMELVAIPVLLALLSLSNKANACPHVPCYFVFGDSLSDNGNNNNLPTLAKVNYPPYGIDFPQGPTGRFCNGRNMHDFIAQLLGFKDNIPAFATSRGRNIFNGVNYASGSAGIRNETESNLGVCIPFNQQIKNHKTIISMITKLMGNYSATNLLLKQCIYSVQIGSNDYINNYFRPKFYETSRRFTPSKYATLLVQQLSLQLKTLYNYGARKFAVYGIGEIGCTPYAISMYRTNRPGCVSKLNKGATLFNNRLKPLIHQLNNNLTDAKFTYLYPSGGPDLAKLETARASGAECKEEMGICNENCSARCELSKNEKGRCKKSSRNETETCMYECGDNHGDGNGLPSPSNKQCSTGIGPCSEHCNDSCCDRLCCGRYPGPQTQ